MITNIVIVGVGGQGALLASRILGALALRMGRDVKVSEVHGMAQRGGSVITHVRIGGEGDSIRSPLVTEGEADVILAFEPLEALRALPYLKPKDGLIITNNQAIPPMTVLTGSAEYPDDIIDKLNGYGNSADNHPAVVSFDAQALANNHNAPRAVNIALIGKLAAYPIGLAGGPDGLIDPAVWEDAVSASVPPRTLFANLEVFRAARAGQ
jgi:indolepyruvate ferredoxin oxidoreductase beta subunit